MSDFTIGLTGGIGSGKSTVANLFAEKNIAIIDADQIARQVVQPNSQATKAIAKKFGAQALLADGNLNRGFLREQIFADKALKKWVDELLHPLINQQMRQQMSAAKSAYCVVDVPLLTENNLQGLFDRVLVVDCTEGQQLERAMLRDGSNRKTIENIIEMQATRTQRHSIANDIIENTGDIDGLKCRVNQLHQQYMLALQQ